MEADLPSKPRILVAELGKSAAGPAVVRGKGRRPAPGGLEVSFPRGGVRAWPKGRWSLHTRRCLDSQVITRRNLSSTCGTIATSGEGTSDHLHRLGVELRVSRCFEAWRTVFLHTDLPQPLLLGYSARERPGGPLLPSPLCGRFFAAAGYRESHFYLPICPAPFFRKLRSRGARGTSFAIPASMPSEWPGSCRTHSPAGQGRGEQL